MALNAWFRQLATSFGGQSGAASSVTLGVRGETRGGRYVQKLTDRTGHLPQEAHASLFDDCAPLTSMKVVERQPYTARPPSVRRPLATRHDTPLAAPSTILRCGNDERQVVPPVVSRTRRAHTFPTAAERPALPPSRTEPSSPALPCRQQQPEARSSAPITIPQPPQHDPNPWPDLTPPTTSAQSDGPGELDSSASRPTGTEHTSDEEWPQVPFGPTVKGELAMTNSVEEQILAQQKDDTIHVDDLTYPLPFPFTRRSSDEKRRLTHQPLLKGYETPRHQPIALADRPPEGEQGWTPDNIRHWRSAISSPTSNNAPALTASAGDSPCELTTPMSLDGDQQRLSPTVVTSSPDVVFDKGGLGLMVEHEPEREVIKQLSQFGPIAPNHLFSGAVDVALREEQALLTPLPAARDLAASQRSIVSPQALDRALRTVLRRYGTSKRQQRSGQFEAPSPLALDLEDATSTCSNEAKAGGDIWADTIPRYARPPKWRRATTMTDLRVELPTPADTDTDDPNRDVVAIRIKSRKRQSKSFDLLPAPRQGVSANRAGDISPPASIEFGPNARNVEHMTSTAARERLKSPSPWRRSPVSRRDGKQESILSRSRPSFDLPEMGKKMSVMHSAQFAFTPLESMIPMRHESVSAPTQPNSPFLDGSDEEIPSDGDEFCCESAVRGIGSLAVGELRSFQKPPIKNTDEARTSTTSAAACKPETKKILVANISCDADFAKKPNEVSGALCCSTTRPSEVQASSPTDSMWTDVSTASSEESRTSPDPSTHQQAILRPMDLPLALLPILLAYFWLWLCLLKTTFDVLTQFAR